MITNVGIITNCSCTIINSIENNSFPRIQFEIMSSIYFSCCRIEEIFKAAEDLTIDIPKLWEYFAKLLGKIEQLSFFKGIIFIIKLEHHWYHVFLQWGLFMSVESTLVHKPLFSPSLSIQSIRILGVRACPSPFLFLD